MGIPIRIPRSGHSRFTMTTSKKEFVIYESPDGGRTVYARKSGETSRHLQSIDPIWEKECAISERWLKLKPAIYMADSDPTLNDALTKLEMLYALKRKENN